MAIREFPGKINYASKTGHHTGSRAKRFWTLWGMNRWFTKNIGLLTIEIQQAPVLLGLWTTTVVIYTNVMTREELQEFDEVNREVQAALDKKRAALAAAKAEAEAEQERLEEEHRKAEEAKKKERDRLIQMGKHHEEHCKKDPRLQGIERKK